MGFFSKSVMIDAPVAEVWAFHERPDALRLLTPKFPPARVVRREGGLEPGARVELRVAGVRWLALHTKCEPRRLFVDQQVQGPFDRWVHRHEFERVRGMTLLTDSVEFEMKWVPAWVIRIGLRQLFAHRHAVTKRMCEERE